LSGRCIRVTDYTLIISIFKYIGRGDRSKEQKERTYRYSDSHTKILWIDDSSVNSAKVTIGRDISKKHLSGNLYLIYRRILGLLFYHPKVCCNGIFNIFDSLINRISLTMATREGRTMYIETIFTFVYYNRVFHVFNLSYA